MTSKIEWIKITTGMFEDEKLEFIQTLPEGDAIITIWIRLLCMAGKCNAGGYIFITEKIPYTDDALASKFRKNVNVIRLALSTLEKMDMIMLNENGVIAITNWAKHQNIDGMEKIREQTRLRMAAYRERLQITDSKKDGSLPSKSEDGYEHGYVTGDVTGDVTVTHPSISISNSSSDSISEKNSEKNSGKKKKPEKHKYGSQENVLISDTEKLRLDAEFGTAFIGECIEFLSLYKAEKNYITKSDNLTIRRWVIEAIKKRRFGGASQPPLKVHTRTAMLDMEEA